MAIEKESPEEYGYEKIMYNLSESAAPDQPLNLFLTAEEIKDIFLSYGPHGGNAQLRRLIASRYPGAGKDNVLVTNGAAEALFLVEISTLKPGDEVIVLHPNYPSDYEVPKSLGCREKLISLRFEEGFALDVDMLRRMINEDTKLISLTYPNNPTGAMITPGELREIIEIVEDCNCLLLMDETYRELSYGEKLPPAASLSLNAVSVSSLSKAHGTPGIRVGWLVSTDIKLLKKIIAAKEQINICNSVVDERIAIEVLKNEEILRENLKHVMENLKIVEEWMEGEELIEWIPPKSGAVCFPRIRRVAKINTVKFYSILLDKYSTFLAPGHWFNMDDTYFRLGFGWPSEEILREGLKNVSRALRDAR